MPVGDQGSIFMSEVPQIIEFDETRAMRYSPPRILQIVRIVEKPAHEETVIMARLSGRETFVGSYVEVLDQQTSKVETPTVTTTS
jgi:hypothetical protein